jgi:uncharacterized membrane protein YkvA (DUF1232 family)
MLDRPKDWARVIKRDVHALYLASRDPRVPWCAKALAAGVAAYALSPIDLIPDFVPILGYVDDVILVPLGLLLVIRLIPPEIMAEHRDSGMRTTRQPYCCCHDWMRVDRVHRIVWMADISPIGWLNALTLRRQETPPIGGSKSSSAGS